MAPATPGRRRGRNDDYLKFNARPKEVGSRTGKPMPTDVPLNEDGFEDPDEFFKSPQSEHAGRALRTPAARGNGRGGRRGDDDSSPSGPATTTRSRRGRMSELDVDDEDEEFEADLLIDDDEVDPNKTPPQPFFQSSPNPPPSVTLPRRSQLPPASPNDGFDSIPSPSARVTSGHRSQRRSTIGVNYNPAPASPTAATATPTARNATTRQHSMGAGGHIAEPSGLMSPTSIDAGMSFMPDISDEFDAQLASTPKVPMSKSGKGKGNKDGRGRTKTASKTNGHVPDDDDDDDVGETTHVGNEEEEEEDDQHPATSQQVRRNGGTKKYSGPAPVEEDSDDAVAPDSFQTGGTGDIDDDDDDTGADFGDMGGYDNDEDIDPAPLANGHGDADDDDDVAMEQAAVDAEEGEEEVEEQEEEEPAPPPVKRGRGRPRKNKEADTSKKAATQSPPTARVKRGRTPAQEPPVAKRSRVSQLPPGDEDYKGDFKTRRSGRQHFRPLEWWRNERFEYTRGEHSAVIKEVVHLPRDENATLSKRPRPGRSSRAASQGARSIRKASSVPLDNDEEGWDNNTNPIAVVNEFPSDREVQRRICYPRALLDPKLVMNSEFKYQKVFGEGKFIASGVVYIPVGGSKPGKPSRDNAYVFYVISGAVSVQVHKTTFVVATGGQFLIPRGNIYSIENVSPHNEAKLFFAQARKIRASEEEEDLLEMARAANARGEELEAVAEEDEEEEDGGEEEAESEEEEAAQQRPAVRARAGKVR